MKTAYRFLLLLLPAIALLESCSVEHETSYREPDLSTGNNTDVNLLLQMPGIAHPTSYAISAADENAIAELDILAFSKNAANADTFCYRVSVDPAKISDLPGGVDGNLKDVIVRLERYPAPLKLVVIANAASILNATTLTPGETYNAVQNKLKFSFSGKWPTSAFAPFPMWGQSSSVIIQDPVVMPRVEVTLLRAIAKIDLGVDVFTADPALGFGARFQLKHIYLYQTRSKGFVMPDTALYNSGAKKVIAPSVPADAALLTAQEYTVPASANGKFYNEIYLTEADTLLQANNLFIVVGACYDGAAESFYRLDFANPAKRPLAILRNHRYLLNIKSVSNAGYATKEDAAAQRSVNIACDLEVFDDNIANISYDGQHFLGLSENDFVLNEQPKRIQVITSHPSGWTVAYSGACFASHTESPSYTEFTPAPLVNSYMREGSITFTAGVLKKTIRVRQYASATMIFSDKAGVSIPVYFRTANLDGVERFVPTAGTHTLKVIWEDVFGTVTAGATSGESASISIAAGAQEANALIGLFSPTNQLLWNWHVWVLNSTSNSLNDINNPDNHITIRDNVFMNRNLGAASTALGNLAAYGLFYQWGRKEPFPGPVLLSATDNMKPLYQGSATPQNLISVASVTAIANPMNDAHRMPATFITGAAPYFTWSGVSEATNGLWTDHGLKAVYDPCPHGWRVPTAAQMLAALTPQGAWNYGQRYQAALSLPAAGAADFSSGKLFGVGSDGFYWIAETFGPKAKALHIKNGSAVIEDAARASGFSVRCIKEKYNN